MNLDYEIEKARRNLPEGYQIRLEIYTGSVNVYVFDPNGKGIDFDDSSDDLAESVFDALNAAEYHHG